MSARENILRRVRAALGGASLDSGKREADARAKMSLRARGPLPDLSWDAVDRFKERCLGLSSTVDEAASYVELPAAVARYLQSHSLPSSLSCWAEFAHLPWQAAGLEVQVRPATGDDKTGVTGCFCAIAETGTLMSLSGVHTPLTNSLLPDTHIAIVPRSRILRCMEDAWDLLRKEHGALPRQVSFISGPSRTADIEMTMVLGIHGPYRVHIILVQDIA